MAKSDADDSPRTGASWVLLTHLLDLLVDKGVLTNQDMMALAEAAHADASAQDLGKKGVARLKKLRERVRASA